MSHFLLKTAVGFSNIMPKPNLKTHVQAKYIGARLISSSLPNWRTEDTTSLEVTTMNQIEVTAK